MHINPGRIRAIRDGEAHGPVIYWMSRDQRVSDNWALLYSLDIARRLNEALAVVFCLTPRFMGATAEDRSYRFMLDGLKELEKRLSGLGIAFILAHGDPGDVIPSLIDDSRAGILVADFSPLRISRTWKSMVAGRTEIPFHEVDAHNIVPCWIASQKQEWSAHTFRLKIRKHLAEFMEEFPDPRPPPRPWRESVDNRWNAPADQDAPSWMIRSGEQAAAAQLERFISEDLDLYASHRNDPTRDVQSGLSPYLHFGQISAQRVALNVMAVGGDHSEFLDELIVRRELADNFCYYNEHYDSMDGMPEWARTTLDDHRGDRRDYIYSHEELECAKTHDDLWNAAQLEMRIRGKMHGYLRMYWAKKILEWSESPEDALRTAIRLNDRYELDGRDPNGYTGCGWSIGGLHDRPFGERPVFGKIRYMSYGGMRRKFDVRKYIDRIFQMADQ
ncbi:MAG: deoxyribodipyrimidine photo-lyase [Methanothrix sp.]|uniref:deoxyribodipyrimidine photo-lyase n=1 Tax=Methanothrix sp. TaxID=90426 RepID=UPI0025D7798D|nr:deoxyribodipyrimidine photo-lyase [Methanothrix sp.]MCQ8902671.1 deoxyribodipyrimidine photo-lyase [Methanothrix sp.]